MQKAHENEVALPSPPRDGITACRFDAAEHASTRLLVSSWDATLSLYATPPVAPPALAARASLPCPVLDCDFLSASSSTSAALTAGLDGVVRLHDLAVTSKNASAAAASCLPPPTELGAHSSGARCVRACPTLPSCAVSGSWDTTLKLWDVRAAQPCVGTFAQPDRVLSLCCGRGEEGGSGSGSGAPLLVVATANRHVMLLDLRQPSEPLQRRESSLKCATRCVAMMPSGAGFTLGSVEGRVAVEYVDPSAQAQAQRYAYKCHRTSVDGVDTAHAVNAIAFHPVYGTFATGGCDGHVYIWDGAKKKRIGALRRYATSIACLAFSPGGERLAIAASYTYEHGEQPGTPPDAVFLHTVSDVLVRPKGWGQQ